MRADADRVRDLVPVATNRARTRFDREIGLEERPFRRFKPVLLPAERETWAQGGNCLALPDRRRDLFCHHSGEPT